MTKCRFYDDGHGNGSYIPGSCCGPPTCLLKGGNEKCEGNTKKCNINTLRIYKITGKINKLKQEL